MAHLWKRPFQTTQSWNSTRDTPNLACATFKECTSVRISNATKRPDSGNSQETCPLILSELLASLGRSYFKREG